MGVGVDVALGVGVEDGLRNFGTRREDGEVGRGTRKRGGRVGVEEGVLLGTTKRGI